MTFGKRLTPPPVRSHRSALTIRRDHVDQVETLITDAVLRIAKAHGLALRNDKGE